MYYGDDYIKNDTVFPPFMYAGKEVHYALGSILCLVGLFGILGNSLVLLVFTRFRRLQGPFSCLIINLAIGDLGTSCLHIMVVVSSFKGKWAFGYTGCVIYAFGVGFFGMMSIFTLAAISLERYLVITSRPLSSWKLTNRGARRVCYVSWIYCTGLTTPPIFGWSRYTLEGLFTSCSWDYTTRSLSNTIYYLYLLGFGFILPVSMITFCYTFIMTAVLAHGKEMATVDMTPGRSGRSARKCRNVNNAHGTALKTAEIILILIAFFMISWTPYATVTLIGHFGPEGVLSPWVTAMPAYFAKMSVIYNPIVYGLSHPHFQSSVKQYISSWRVSSSGSSCKQDEHYSTTKGGTVALNTIKHDRHFRCFLTKPLEDVESEGQLEEQDRRLFQETLYQHVRKDSSSLEPIGLSQGGISSSASTVSVNIHIKKLRECYV